MSPELRAVLGDLATAPGLHRIPIPPLTVAGVATVIGSAPLDPVQLHRMTGGNAFYVTEVVRTPGWVVPPTVSDAVLARVGRLSAPAREVLAAVAESPGGLEPTILETVVPASGPPLDECGAAGVLVPLGRFVAFRHEIARLTVLDAEAPARRADLSRRLLAALVDAGSADDARLTHHSHVAGDRRRVRVHSVWAAESAALHGAHRVAAGHLATVLEHADDLSHADRAELLSRWAAERSAFDEDAELVALWDEVVAEWQLAGNPARAAVARAEQARVIWAVGDSARAMEVALEAVAALEGIEPSPQAHLAMAYAVLAWLCMLTRQAEDSVRWARRAIAAGEGGDAEVPLMIARNALGAAMVVSGGPERPGWPEDGIAELEASREVAERLGRDDRVCSALVNLGSGLGEVRVYGRAEAYLEAATAYGLARDLDGNASYAISWRARIAAETGRWDEVDAFAHEALRLGAGAVITRIVARTALGRVRTRRGLPGADEQLTEAAELAERTGDLQRTWPVAAARAELAWLTGHEDRIPDLIDEPLETAGRLGMRWAVGELALWGRRAGLGVDAGMAGWTPFVPQAAGDWATAAAAWTALGCPYEAAECLGDGDPAAMRRAVDLLDRLGARPAADRVRGRMRALGLADVPPRPRAGSREAPAGLTERQQEVLALLVAGLSNAQIARRLVISEKTADHHVSAVLRKLGVRSRGQAAAAAHRLGIAAPEA